MNLKKMMKITMTVAMTFAVSFSSLHAGKIHAQAATSCVGIKCYNVQDNFGKGDATMINCGNNRYILVDCGSEKDSEHLLKRIGKTCKTGGYENDAEKVYIPALILTHNHNDHMGGLETILKNTHVGKIYYNKIAVSKGAIKRKKTIKNLAKKYSVPTQAVSTKQILHIDPSTGNDGSKDNTVTVYGPAKDFTKNTANADDNVKVQAENNSSMIVDIHGGYNAILLGDLLPDGLAASIKAYKSNKDIFKANYNLCKFGHHGLRVKYHASEIKNYNTYINAKNYVFTATFKEAKAADERKNGEASCYSNLSKKNTKRIKG